MTGSQKGLYKYLEQTGLYLPKINSKCMSDNYLECVLKSKVFTLKSSYVKKPPFINTCTKQELILEINKIIDDFNRDKTQTQKIYLGFDDTNPADKEWLKCALFLLNPSHEFFHSSKHILDKKFLDMLSKQ